MNASEKVGKGSRDMHGADAPQAQPMGMTETKGAAKQGKEIDESEVFREGIAPQYFGAGSYGRGGSNQEGHYGLGESNPQGGVGSFTDAGGYGSSTLYGLDVPPAEQSSAADEQPAKASQAPAAGEKKPHSK